MADKSQTGLARPPFRLAAFAIAAFVIYVMVQLVPMLFTEWWHIPILLAVSALTLLPQMISIALTGRAFRFTATDAVLKSDDVAANNPAKTKTVRGRTDDAG